MMLWEWNTGANKENALIYLVSVMTALVQKLLGLKSLLLQFLDGKLKLVALLGGRVALKGAPPRPQVIGTLHPTILETLLVLRRHVAGRARTKRSVRRINRRRTKTYRFASGSCKLGRVAVNATSARQVCRMNVTYFWRKKIMCEKTLDW